MKNGPLTMAGDFQSPPLGQISKKELEAALALLVNKDEDDPDIHHSCQPKEPIHPRQTTDPSPRHNKFKSPKEQPTSSCDEDDAIEDNKLPRSKSPGQTPTIIPVSQSTEVGKNVMLPSVSRTSKESYYMRRGFIFSGRGGASMAESSTPKQAFPNLSSISRNKSPFGTVRSALATIMPSFFGNSHSSTPISRSLLSSSKQGNVADTVAPQSAPNMRERSRPISRRNSRRNSRPDASTGPKRPAVPKLDLQQLTSLSPVLLQPLVEAQESSLHSYSGQGLSSMSSSSLSATGVPSEQVPGPYQDSESESASPDTLRPGSAGPPPTIPLVEAAAPSLRDLLEIGFVLSPRDGNDDDAGSVPADDAHNPLLREGKARQWPIMMAVE